MASNRPSSHDPGGGAGSSLFPQSDRNDIYGISELSNSDLDLLRLSFRTLARMTDKAFKIVSATSGVDMAFVPQIADPDAILADDNDEAEHENPDPDRPLFYGPDNIPRSIRENIITYLIETELWLYGGALNNINAIVIKPRTFPKPIAINSGTGNSVDRYCFVELMTPLCGDSIGEMTVKPRKAGIGVTRNRNGQCFARILSFKSGYNGNIPEPDLRLDNQGAFSVCVDKDDASHTLKAEVYTRSFAGPRPIWADGTKVQVILGIKSGWYMLPLHKPSSRNEDIQPMSDPTGVNAWTIRLSNKLRTKIDGYHRERVDWNPVLKWDQSFHQRARRGNNSGGGGGGDGAGPGGGGGGPGGGGVGGGGAGGSGDGDGDSSDNSGDSRGSKRRRGGASCTQSAGTSSSTILPGGYVVPKPR